jgi:uncharacterized protein (TIGR02271 family)
MALHKIKDFYPEYQDQLDNQDVIGYSLYSGEEKVGSIDDLLVDDNGKFRYLVVNTGVWIFGKKVLLPIGRTQIDYNDRRVYVNGLTREQVEQLPEYNVAGVDQDHEDRVRNVYRPRTGATAPLDTNTPLESNASLNRDVTNRDITNRDVTADRTIRPENRDVDAINRTAATRGDVGYTADRANYSYDQDPDLYNLNDADHRNLKLYEERLIANKTRQKTGEVAIGKRIVTEEAHVSVPVDRERVVVERVTPTSMGEVVTPGVDAFQEGEVARMEVYEETPEIRKEAFVREEVQIRKEVDHDTVEANETLRREQLNIDKDGNPIVQDR